MSTRCEICGRIVHGQTILIEVDGAVLRVCNSCSRLGSPIKRREVKVEPKSIVKHKIELKMPEVELRRDYHKIIKQAREQMNLSQEQLGRKIGEKPSVIKLLESGKLKPDDALAKKISHFLKVGLLVPVEEE